MTNLFNTLMQYRATFWIDIPRQIFVWIDSAIYWLISSVYGLIEDLARIQIFRESTLNNFYNKIYLLLSIFMLFKVSFSIVSYILDPAKTVDKNSGFGKIITNVVIMFVMILSAPIAFKYLTKLQNAILDDDIILNFVFGDVGSTNVNNEIQLADSERCQEWSKIHDGMRKYNPASPGMSIANNNGDYLAVTIYRVFFTLADTKVETGKGPDDHKNGGKTLDVKKGKYVFDFMCNDNNTHISVSDMASFVNAYVDEINEAGSNGYYLIEYKFFVATAVGVFALLMLINIAFETSVRAIKLGFYQLIAPIPIISYIDPNSSKNGVFSKYIKALGKTWISLFIRLFSLYFAIFVIKEFNTNFVQDLGELHSSKFFITLFVIIGALMFAKQLPQLIEELFPGMKMGKMQLNPFKNIAENAAGGKLLLGVGAAAGAAGLGMTTNMGSRIFDGNTWKNRNGKATFGSVMNGIGKTLSSGIAGAGSSGFRAGRMTAKDGKIGKGMWTGYQESNKARFDRDDNLRKAGVVTAGDKFKYFMGSLGADAARLTGNLTKGQRDQIRLQEMKSTLEQSKYNLEQRKNAALEPVKSYSSYMDQIKDEVDNDSAVKKAKENYELAKQGMIKGAHGKGAVAEYKSKFEAAEREAYSKVMSTEYGQKLKSAAISATNSMNLSAEEKTAYSNFDNYSSFKKNRGDSKTLASSRALDFVNDEQNIKAQEAAIHEFENSSDYKMGQATNNDRRSTGTLKAGQQVNPNVGNVMDNPYYDPGYYGNNGGPGRPPRGGNGGGPRGGGRP